MIKPFIVCVLFPAASAFAQMSIEDAEARLRIRQCARMMMATTQPTTRPIVLPATWAAVLEEDRARESTSSFNAYTRPRPQHDFSGIVFGLDAPIVRFNEPSPFGMHIRDRSPGASSSQTSSSSTRVWVHSFVRSDGTHVDGFWRHRPSH